MKKIIKIASIAVILLLIVGSVSVYSALHNFGEKWTASHPTETLSETMIAVSLTDTTTLPETIATTVIKETITVKPTEKKTESSIVATTRVLKYEIAEISTREYAEKRMKNYDKEHYFFYDHEMDFVVGFAYNNEELKKKYGEDFDILTAGGRVGSSYPGAGFYAKKGKIVQGGAHCYIVRKGAHPLTGDGWQFKISFLAQEGWRVDDYYFDQEYTDAYRDAWDDSDKEGMEAYFSIKILE